MQQIFYVRKITKLKCSENIVFIIKYSVLHIYKLAKTLGQIQDLQVLNAHESE